MTPITEKTPPQFPCWLWNATAYMKPGWFHATDKSYWRGREPSISNPDTHWSPDSPTAPTAAPAKGEPVSKCCRAPMIVASADEGTNYHVCTKCQQPTDAVGDGPQATPGGFAPHPDALAAAREPAMIAREAETHLEYAGIPDAETRAVNRHVILGAVSEIVNAQVAPLQQEIDRLRGEVGALHGKLGLFAKEHFNINDNLPTPETFERLGMWITALKGQRDTLRKESLRFRIAVAEATGWEHVCPPEEDGGRDFWQFRENHDQKIDEPKDLPDCCDELEGQWEHMVSQVTRLTELTAALAPLAAWNKKYPKGTTYSMNLQKDIDGELDAICDVATALTPSPGTTKEI